MATDKAMMSRLLPIEDAASSQGDAELVRELAIRCRERFQTDFGLAIGPLPPVGGAGEAGHVYFALASAAGERSLHVSSGIHPDIVADYLAKHAINLLRLELIG